MFKEKIKKGYTIKVTTKEELNNLTKWLEENMGQKWLADIELVLKYLESNDNLVYLCPEEDDYNSTHEYTETELITYEEALINPNKMPELKAGMIVDLKFNVDNSIKTYLLLEGEGKLQPINPTDGRRGSNLEEFTVVKIYSSPIVYFTSLFEDASTRELDVVWELKEKSEKDLKIEELEKTINDASETIEKAKEQIEELKGC